MSIRTAVLASALVLASCARKPAEGAAAGEPFVVRTRDGVATSLPAPPVRVVPVNTAAAEFVCAVLSAERVAALPEQVDAYSYRAFAGAYERIPRFARYQAEVVIGFDPDLVVTHAWQSAETTEVLRTHGVPILVLRSAETYADVRATVLELGRIVGAADAARDIVAGLDERVAKLEAGAAPRAKLRALVYSNDGSGGWTAGARTTADTMIRMAGLRNAAADAGIESHVPLDFERLISIDPDVLIVSRPARDDVGSPTVKTLAATPALRGLSALVHGRIAELPSPLMSSDSLSLVQAAEELAAQVDRW